MSLESKCFTHLSRPPPLLLSLRAYRESFCSQCRLCLLQWGSLQTLGLPRTTLWSAPLHQMHPLRSRNHIQSHLHQKLLNGRVVFPWMSWRPEGILFCCLHRWMILEQQTEIHPLEVLKHYQAHVDNWVPGFSSPLPLCLWPVGPKQNWSSPVSPGSGLHQGTGCCHHDCPSG